MEKPELIFLLYVWLVIRLNDLKRWHEGFERKEQTSTVSPGNTLKLEKDDPRFVWPIPQHELDAPGVDLMPNESNK